MYSFDSYSAQRQLRYAERSVQYGGVWVCMSIGVQVRECVIERDVAMRVLRRGREVCSGNSGG